MRMTGGHVTFSEQSDVRKSMRSFSVAYRILKFSPHTLTWAAFNAVLSIMAVTSSSFKKNSGALESITCFRQATLASGNLDISKCAFSHKESSFQDKSAKFFN